MDRRKIDRAWYAIGAAVIASFFAAAVILLLAYEAYGHG